MKGKYLKLAALSSVILLSGCVHQAVTQSAKTPKSATPAMNSATSHTLMVSSDERYPLPLGSIMHFAPETLAQLNNQNSSEAHAYHWLHSQLDELLNYRGFTMAPQGGTLNFVIALYDPQQHSNTESLSHIYKSDIKKKSGESISLLLRIYRNGALDPLWQGAVDDFARRTSDGEIKIDPKQGRDTLIRLLRTIPLKQSSSPSNR